MANSFSDNAMQIELDGGRDLIVKCQSRCWCGSKRRWEPRRSLYGIWIYDQGHDL